MDSEFVKECTCVLEAAEILCSEIGSFLKTISFLPTQYLIEMVGNTHCQLEETCEDVVACYRSSICR
jgi:hypothetical protein